MRKARQRAIRRAFRAANGRQPRGVEVRFWGFGVVRPKVTEAGKRIVRDLLGRGETHLVSEWRRVKKAVVRARRAGLPVGAAMAAAVGR